VGTGACKGKKNWSNNRSTGSKGLTAQSPYKVDAKLYKPYETSAFKNTSQIRPPEQGHSKQKKEEEGKECRSSIEKGRASSGRGRDTPQRAARGPVGNVTRKKRRNLEL